MDGTHVGDWRIRSAPFGVGNGRLQGAGLCGVVLAWDFVLRDPSSCMGDGCRACRVQKYTMLLCSYLRFAVAELHARLTRQCVVGLAQCTGHNGVSAKHHRVVVSIAAHLSPASSTGENSKGNFIFKLHPSKEMQLQSHVPPH